MDKYKLTLAKDSGGTFDITPMISNLSWRDSLESLGMELSFDCLRNLEDRYMKNKDIIELGDKLVLTNKGEETFKGIIVDLDTKLKSKSITAFDYAFYLNQSSTVKQFNKINADSAIKQLCGEFNIPIGKVTSMTTKINKIYNQETISDIIRDIISLTEKELGKKYRLEMRSGKLYIEEYKDLLITPRFKPAPNLSSINSADVIGAFSYSESITDMKNSIIVSSGDEKKVNINATAKDNASIKKYGLLQSAESVNDKDIAQARNIANNKLQELNRVKEDISIKVLGDDKVRSGRILKINNEMYNLKGSFLVKESNHSFQNTHHVMDLTLQRM